MEIIRITSSNSRSVTLNYDRTNTTNEIITAENDRPNQTVVTIFVILVGNTY